MSRLTAIIAHMGRLIGVFSSLVMTIAFFACQPNKTNPLREALTFHASFDLGTNADYSLGDERIYTAKSRRQLDESVPGLQNADHTLLNEGGKWGGAFQFGKKSDTVIFYKSKGNVEYNPESWSGTVSFYLNLDPATDLEPGYTDPIQVTDVNYNDAAIWVDFTNENPRDFRLGIIGDKNVWEQDSVNSSPEEEFERRLVRVKNPPFKKGSWTHLVITYSALGTPQSSYELYINGELIGAVKGIDDPFTWEIEKSNIFLGLNFTGLMDELSFFNRPLTAKEVKDLYSLSDGVKSLL